MAKPGHGLGSISLYKEACAKSSGASLAKRPHMESRTETHPGGKKSADGSASASSADARKMGSHGGQHS